MGCKNCKRTTAEAPKCMKLKLQDVNEKIILDQIPETFEALKRAIILLYTKRLADFEYSDYVIVEKVDKIGLIIKKGEVSTNRAYKKLLRKYRGET